MTLQFDPIACIALVLSAYATWQSVRFNERQKSLIESQERLNKRLLEKEDAEAENDRMANLGATFVKIGSNNHRLRIWNKGKAPARNVTIEPLEGCDCLMLGDINRKFPLEILEPHQSVELIAAVHMGTKSKQPICLRWSDDSADAREKVLYPTL